ncbi:hypothetical protein ACLOJK_007402 [Asimina triloba]
MNYEANNESKEVNRLVDEASALKKNIEEIFDADGQTTVIKRIEGDKDLASEETFTTVGVC